MDNFEKFYNRVLHFLSFRPRSEKEIKDYLNKLNAGIEIQEKIISSLKKSKFLDDVEFAKWWVEQRVRVRPRAWRTIKFELKRKGIDEQIIDSVEINEEKDFESALSLAQKRKERLKNESSKKAYEKMARYLSSKGFNYDIIKEVIDRVFTKGYNN